MPPTDQPPVVEAVYYRYLAAYKRKVETIDEALSFIDYGEREGTMSSVGVFVDGDPVIWEGFLDQKPPTEDQAQKMREAYAKAHG